MSIKSDLNADVASSRRNIKPLACMHTSDIEFIPRLPLSHSRFAIEVKDWAPTRLAHNVWGFGDTSGRFLEGFVAVRQIVPPSFEAFRGEQGIRAYLVSLIDSSGVVYNPDAKTPDHMVSQCSALSGLVSDFEDDRKAAVRDRIEKFIIGLNRMAIHKGDYLMFPQVATKIAPQAHFLLNALSSCYTCEAVDDC